MLLEVSNIKKSFQDNLVLENLSLSLDLGESICITGANGSGKSTLLKICSGLLHPDQGAISVLEKSFQSQGLEIRRRIGVLLHSNMLYPTYTIRQNLYLFAKILGIIEYKSRVGEIVERLGLDNSMDKEVQKLSNGNKRKVGLCKSLLNDPDLLIVDEPESNLDEESLKTIAVILMDRAKGGKGNIFTSHSVEFSALCSTKSFKITSKSLVLL
tara:strand:- start:1309 stop:1947 length:639 start_codon:yes stop_codon:yes gene_type:complete